KEPCWSIRSTNLIRGYGSKLTDLNVLYKGQQVENLSIARIIFWNKGAETVQRQDLVDADPLRLVGAGQLTFLDVKLLATNNEPSLFSVSLTEDGGSVLIGFDYLDQGHGAVFQIVHTGTSPKDIKLRGSIKGAKTLRRVEAVRASESPRRAKLTKPER